MRSRYLLATLAVAPLVGGLLATTSATSATSASAPLNSRAGGISAVVTAPIGGDWAVRFVDDGGTMLASVDHDAVALLTAGGRVLADHVVSVDGDVVELGTADAGLTATVQVSPGGDGVYAVDVDGHGEGITGVSIDLRAPKGEGYLGLGERSNAVDHRGKSVLNRVMDGPYTENQAYIVKGFVPAPGLGARPDSTYFPVPWVLSTTGYGVLVDNDEDSTFELATRKHPGVNRLIVRSDHLDLRVFGGPTPAQALARMTETIGRQPAPSSPQVFGAWYQARSDIRAEISDQRANGTPISVAQTYLHYFPCGQQVPEREIANTQALHALGVAVTTYINPMVCTSYKDIYDKGIATDAFTKAADGSTLVYPYSTASHFVVSQFDFSAEPGQDLFQSVLQQTVDHGYDGWMEDFGEYTPDDAVSADGAPGTAVHNRYAEQYHAAAREFEEQAPRPLLRFQRSGWTDAIKDSSIVWGGDPTTGWEFDGLTSSVTQALTMGLSGISIWGSDIGGFMTLPGDPQQTSELLTRWIEFGAFSGVMRLQSGGIAIGAPEKPQVSDPDIAPVWKRYTRLRTMLYPYIAGSQDAYATSGLPLMRHLALVHPSDAQAVSQDDEYLFGSDLLVAPVTAPGTKSRKVYLPRGQWLELARTWNLDNTGRLGLRRADLIDGKRTVTARAPLGTIPLFLRVGAVIPLLPRTVDTLSDYGTDVVHLDDEADRRTLLAAPTLGDSTGTLGPDETVTSQVTKGSWTLRLDATQARTYDVRATLAGLKAAWTPCAIEADGADVPFTYHAGRRVLTFKVDAATDGAIRVTACR